MITVTKGKIKGKVKHKNYPWQQWLNSGFDVLVFERGKHFDSQPYLFRQTGMVWCKTHGYGVVTSVEEDVVTFTVHRRPEMPGEEATLFGSHKGKRGK